MLARVPPPAIVDDSEAISPSIADWVMGPTSTAAPFSLGDVIKTIY
jgi:hypothetical protein